MKIPRRVLAIVAAPAITITVWAMPASATTATPATPATKTCAAFKTWNVHRTTANLNTMMTDSEAAPWKYVGEDAASLYADVRSNATKYVAKDVVYFGQDCRS
jgi:hypothetical protein